MLKFIEDTKLNVEPYYSITNDGDIHTFTLLSRKQESFRPNDFTIIDLSFTPAQYLYKETFRTVESGLCLDGGTDLSIPAYEVKGMIEHFDSELEKLEKVKNNG